MSNPGYPPASVTTTTANTGEEGYAPTAPSAPTNADGGEESTPPTSVGVAGGVGAIAPQSAAVAPPYPPENLPYPKAPVNLPYPQASSMLPGTDHLFPEDKRPSGLQDNNSSYGSQYTADNNSSYGQPPPPPGGPNQPYPGGPPNPGGVFQQPYSQGNSQYPPQPPPYGQNYPGGPGQPPPPGQYPPPPPQYSQQPSYPGPPPPQQGGGGGPGYPPLSGGIQGPYPPPPGQFSPYPPSGPQQPAQYPPGPQGGGQLPPGGYPPPMGAPYPPNQGQSSPYPPQNQGNPTPYPPPASQNQYPLPAQSQSPYPPSGGQAPAPYPPQGPPRSPHPAAQGQYQGGHSQQQQAGAGAGIPYQEFSEDSVEANSNEAGIRSGLMKLAMKSDKIRAGVDMYNDAKKKIDKFTDRIKTGSKRPSKYFYAREDINVSPSPAPPVDPPKQTFYGDVNKKNIEINRFKGQNYEKIKRECRSKGRPFSDPEFDPSRIELGGGGQGYMRVFYQQNEIKWMRPNEIVRNPVLFDKDVNRFDINQGEIGDCWFLASLAILAENREQFKRVVPDLKTNPQDCFRDGIFRFRFYSFNKWTEVVIDDRLPTRNGKLIYLKSRNPNEFWSPLLEKAYAKLYGGYKNLEGGLSIEASVDFTGGIPEVINLTQLNEDPKYFFNYLKEADSRRAFLTCSLSNSRNQQEGQRKGLQSRHAYTITKVTEVRGYGTRSIPLIRLRNPHGNANEWTGDWSDRSSQWNQIDQYQKKQLGLSIDTDGEFYMNFDRDFLRYFGEVEIVHLSAKGFGDIKGQMPGSSTNNFKQLCFEGEWSQRRGTAGGCGNDGVENFARNPQFMFSIKQPSSIQKCPVVISLAQRPYKRKQEHAIGFRIYQLSDPSAIVDRNFLSRNDYKAKTEAYINLREVSLRANLREGSYVVIPSTFARGEEAQFLLRLYFDEKWQPKQIPSAAGSGGKAASPSAGRNIPIQRSFYSFGGGQPYVPVYGNFGANVTEEGDQVDGGHPVANQRTSICDLISAHLKQVALQNFNVKTASDLCKVLYHWPKDRDAEMDILKKVARSLPAPTQDASSRPAIDRSSINQLTDELRKLIQGTVLK
eukprot:TRINITY_DN20190_c0_g1_i4.p1 TRINITY_DN20190_c0_g1~~TRINITY_DN20190_c0_g1_i4.p1  ORF type:complete len:1092 (+),score=254.97 TRINITY_DN20190_c0_g1_i4:65-3340(+)